MNNSSPYLSIVVTSRNDDHGGHLLDRMQMFIRHLVHSAEKYQVSCELLIVEWNPPSGNPGLYEVLEVKNNHVPVRFIEVPGTLHDRYYASSTLELHQMIAKNAGIRRAKGQYVLCTNIDNVFSAALWAEIGRRSFQQHHYYRANRCDVVLPDIVSGVLPDESSLKLYVVKRWGMHPAWPGLKIHSQGFFMYRNGFFSFLYPFLLLIKKMLLGRKRYSIARLDKEACGDFTLMSRDDWFKIGGYPELPVYPQHQDSLALMAASAVGIKQVILDEDCCTFHIEHGKGWEEMQQSVHDGLSWNDAEKTGLIMLNRHCSYPDQNPNWGLSNVQLQEIVY